MSLNASGPPATPKQIQYLTALLEKAGYPTFRDARRPLGLTQRQGSGRFTRREASDLIDRLLATEDADEVASDAAGSTASDVGGEGDPMAQAESRLIGRLSAEVLADELRRRGWTAIPPTGGGDS